MSYSSRNHHIQFSMHYLDSPAPCRHLTKVSQDRIYSYGLNELTIYTSGVSYAPYVYGTIIRTIRVCIWLYHMRIHVWYVPYVYGINTRMVQNMTKPVKTGLMELCTLPSEQYITFLVNKVTIHNLHHL